MSVYTRVEHSQLEEFLTHYNLGHLVAYQGINAGIVNTNYFVTTTTGKFVLTLFEHLNNDELPYFLELMAYLAEHGIPTAHPLAAPKSPASMACLTAAFWASSCCCKVIVRVACAVLMSRTSAHKPAVCKVSKVIFAR